MSSLFDWDGFEYRDLDGGLIGDGSLDQPNIVSGLTLSFKNQVNLAQNAIGTLWTNTTGPTDFQYCRIIADQGTAALPVMLETTTDITGSIATGYYTQSLLAGFPFKLYGSASYANYTNNFAGGTLKAIQRFRVKNLNATTANVYIWLFN